MRVLSITRSLAQLWDRKAERVLNIFVLYVIKYNRPTIIIIIYYRIVRPWLTISVQSAVFSNCSAAHVMRFALELDLFRASTSDDKAHAEILEHRRVSLVTITHITPPL